MQPEDHVADLPGIGPKVAKELEKSFEIVTMRQLVEHYPRRHQDLGARMDLDQIIQGEPATLVGHIRGWNQKVVGKGGRLKISEAVVDAVGGGTFMVTFFNQPWKPSKLRPGTRVAASGKVEYFRGAPKIDNPELEVMGPRDEVGEGDRLLPIYAANDRLPSWKIAAVIEQALALLPPWADHLPMDLLDRHDLIALDEAHRWIHRPDDKASLTAAKKRLRFDELFTLQTGLFVRRHQFEQDVVGFDNHPRPNGDSQRYLDSLPFEPTGAQKRAFEELGVDLGRDRPMHRLLQGDVGAGKTLVAVWTMLCAVDAGRQAAMMAPTEVLAEQHHRTLMTQLAPLGVNIMDGLRVELLTSSTPAKQKRRILSELLTGETDMVVGTHALLEEGVRFAELGVVVIDEQHRFGVAQRIKLQDKSNVDSGTPTGSATPSLPDVLTMTATPIPRSIALTAYGDLDVTVLDELPPGRKPIVTTLITPVEADGGRRRRLYDFIREQVAVGLQAYIVCPLVEESPELAGVADAISMHRDLQDNVFPELTVGLVHGRLKSDEKESAMTGFRAGAIQVLVATTVIEVGVDVPQASVMVIEDADRFGMSQLHQLRGRVGRGADKSYCVLFADPVTDDARDRLQAIVGTTDGFLLAEKDLEIRGEGQLFGTKQSGLPDLKLVRLIRDRKLISSTRDAARRLLDRDPELEEPGHRALRAEVLRRFEGLDLLDALRTG